MDVEEFLKRNVAKRVVVQVSIPRVVKNPSAFGLTVATAVCDQRYFGLQEFHDVPIMILPWGSFGIMHEGNLKVFPMDRLYELEFARDSDGVRTILENSLIAAEDQMRMIAAMKRAQAEAHGGVG